jgi:hypothetical protein
MGLIRSSLGYSLRGIWMVRIDVSFHHQYLHLSILSHLDMYQILRECDRKSSTSLSCAVQEVEELVVIPTSQGKYRAQHS